MNPVNIYATSDLTRSAEGSTSDARESHNSPLNAKPLYLQTMHNTASPEGVADLAPLALKLGLKLQVMFVSNLCNKMLYIQEVVIIS